MAEEDTKSLAVPGNADSDGSSSRNINANEKPSFSDKECDNDAYRESIASVNDNVEPTRRNSTGKPNSPKITPHYLLASTGSCHDNCKHGLKPDFEEKEKRPWIKRFANSLGKQNGVVTVDYPTEVKKLPLPRSVSFPVNLSRLVQHEASSDAINSPHHHHKFIKGKIMLPPKIIEASLEQDPSSDRKMPKKGKGITDGSGEQSPCVMRRTASRDSLEYGYNNTYKAEKKLNHSSEKISPPLHSQRVKAKLSRSMQGAGSIKETSAISKEALKSSKIVSSKIPYSIEISSGANGSNKTSDDKKISKANTKLSLSLLTERRLKRDDVLLTKKNKSASSSSSRPSIGRTIATKPRNVGRSKSVSCIKDQNRTLQKDIRKTSVEHVPVKTLHVVVIETKAKLTDSTEVGDIIPPLPELNLSLDLPCLSSHEEVGGGEREVVVDKNDGRREDEVKREAEEKEEGEEEEEEEHAGEDEVEQQGDEKGQQQLEYEELEMDEEGDYDNDDEEKEEEEENEYESDEEDESIIGNKTNYDDLNTVLKKGHIISESEDSMQVKVKFREGKILDIDSENKAPRRLRFRRRRIVEEKGINNEETRKRNFNKRHNSKANSNSTKEDQKIVLRHQDLEEKKDDQGLLLNNVIEETASKLAESRKSKVKALVGAFETVISRHDSKLARRLASPQLAV